MKEMDEISSTRNTLCINYSTKLQMSRWL